MSARNEPHATRPDVTRGEFLQPDPMEHFTLIPDYYLHTLTPEQYRGWLQTYQQAYALARAQAADAEARYLAQFEFDQGAGI